MPDFERAAHAHDVEAVIACFANDIVIRSPVTQRTRFAGIEQASDLFRRVMSVISDIEFYETIGEGEKSQVIFWRGRVGSQYLEEANLLRLDDDGRIAEMTVFMRPIPGLLALATGLAASLAGRRHPIRGQLVRMLLGTLSALHRWGEPAVIALTGAGIPVSRAERIPKLSKRGSASVDSRTEGGSP
jgi:hypothetical protein